MKSQNDQIMFWSVGGVLLVLVAFLLWFVPTYGVWQAGLGGKAALMRAEQEKQKLLAGGAAQQIAAELLNPLDKLTIALKHFLQKLLPSHRFVGVTDLPNAQCFSDIVLRPRGSDLPTKLAVQHHD